MTNERCEELGLQMRTAIRGLESLVAEMEAENRGEIKRQSIPVDLKTLTKPEAVVSCPKCKSSYFPRNLAIHLFNCDGVNRIGPAIGGFIATP